MLVPIVSPAQQGKVVNLDQLADDIVKSANEKLADDLKHWIGLWKKDDKTVEELVNMVEKWLGNVWFKEQADQQKCYNLWKSFREKVIERLGGMTINERLYHFSLFDRYEQCPSRDEKLKIYTKLHAKP